MIVVDKNTALTYENLASWIGAWCKDDSRLSANYNVYKNTNGSEPLFKLPFAKKLVITSVSATVGDGVTLTAGDLDAAQERTFDELQRLFKKQNLLLHDRKIIKNGAIMGRGYELAYFSDDFEPVPKVASLSPQNAFVVFDNTVEHKSLYGVKFSVKKDQRTREELYEATVYDNTYIYEAVLSIRNNKDSTQLQPTGVHNMGRVPLTEYHNNDEEQGDFEQVIGLINDRSTLHNLNLQDAIAIAKNYLYAKGLELSGVSVGEKNKTQSQMARSQRIEVVDSVDKEGGYSDLADKEVSLLSKNEDYKGITEFGDDIDKKIYSLSLIPDVSDEQFAGNQSGVAIEHKYMPLKQLCAEKDEEIEKLYRRRIKMYIHALAQKGFAYLDDSLIDVKIVRTWSKVETEIASTIATLKATGLPFSDKSLIELFPNMVYETEARQRKDEIAEGGTSTQADSAYLQWLTQALGGGTDDNSEE